MNFDKLVKQVRREAAANPKKAAALGLMVLVALYFWGPLVWKWVSPAEGKRMAKNNIASLILTDDPIPANQLAKGKPGGGKFKWERARQLVRSDAKMRSASFEPSWTDPFRATLPSANPPAIETAVSAEPPPSLASLEPGDFGISVTSIMVGGKKGLATINGQPCREGDLLVLSDKNDKTMRAEFRVKQISRMSVVLERGGEAFEVKMSRPALASGDDLEIGKTRK